MEKGLQRAGNVARRAAICEATPHALPDFDPPQTQEGRAAVQRMLKTIPVFGWYAPVELWEHPPPSEYAISFHNLVLRVAMSHVHPPPQKTLILSRW